MGNTRQKHEQDTAIKLRFYFMSLWLLFVLIFLLTVDIPICFSKDAHFIGFGPLLKRNWLAFISLFFAILGWLVASREKQRWAGVTNPPYEIESIKNENYEYLTFLTTYIIPLICIDLTKIRYVFVLAVLLVLIGFIFIRMDEYDYDSYPEELNLFKQFNIEEAVNIDHFNFNTDDLNHLFGYIVYIGSMESGIVLFKKHYPIL